jgi:hypothetical protein
MTSRTHSGKRRRPRLEPKEQFEARLNDIVSGRHRGQALAHQDLVRGLERILEAHRKRRAAQEQKPD